MCVCIFVLFKLTFFYLTIKDIPRKFKVKISPACFFYADVEEKGLFNFPYKLYT